MHFPTLSGEESKGNSISVCYIWGQAVIKNNIEDAVLSL